MFEKLKSIITLIKANNNNSKKKISEMDLFNLLKNKNATIIDVRTQGEFNTGHVANSQNIPVDQVPKMVEDFKSMDKPIILCCASGARSGMATEYLTQMGVEEVYNGGSWKDVDLQLIK